TAAALGVAISQQVAAATPVGLAGTVTGAALAQTLGTAAGAAGFMGISKLSLGIAGAIAVVAATSYAWQTKTNAMLRSELTALRQQQHVVAALRNENRQLAANIAEIELLRRDDAELKQLSQQVADVQ